MKLEPGDVITMKFTVEKGTFGPALRRVHQDGASSFFRVPGHQYHDSSDLVQESNIVSVEKPPKPLQVGDKVLFKGLESAMGEGVVKSEEGGRLLVKWSGLPHWYSYDPKHLVRAA